MFKFYIYVDDIEKDQIAFELEESCSSSFLSENDREVEQELCRKRKSDFGTLPMELGSMY